MYFQWIFSAYVLWMGIGIICVLGDHKVKEFVAS